MELVSKKYVIVIMKSKKREIPDETDLPHQESIRTLGEKENYKYFGIFGVHTNQTSRNCVRDWNLTVPPNCTCAN